MGNQMKLFDKVNNWIRNSVTLKLMAITILMLLLLIPSAMIEQIISERELLSEEAIQEVSSKWAGSQQINGPILTIPVVFEETIDNKTTQTTRYYHILPEELNINGEIEPQKLKRGIHEVVVYKSDLGLSGSFNISKKIIENNILEIQYDRAFLTVGLSDLRGIKDEVVLQWNKEALSVEPGSKISGLIESGFTIDLPPLSNSTSQRFDFSLDLKLRGSQTLSLTPLGSITNAKLNSSWKDPSFNGNFLPDDRDITDDGFRASWKVLQLNRNYPQQWFGSEYAKSIKDSGFGLDLILPIDDYQKSMRSSKYGAMMIALTFLIFFVVEILNKRKIHPFQYILVGLGLCLFYILLVSISEHLGFDLAYLISAIAIIGMISVYSFSVFKNRKFSILVLVAMSGIYNFMYVTLQLAEYALLMGSIGLTIILGATMYLTRNIDWYKINIPED